MQAEQNIMMDPVLVTGSAGLVGYQVAKSLHEAGIDVLGVDLRPSDGPFPATVADVADLNAMQPLIERRPNVVHAGAISGPMLMLNDPYGIARANLGGALTIFEACRRAQVRRLVWLSSIAVYGDQPTLDPVPESTPMNPQSFYGHTKSAGEILLHGYVARYELDAVALRLSSVFAPRRQTEFGLRSVIQAGLAGHPVEVAEAGTSYRQYMHVDDAAEAVRLALAAPSCPRLVYNITGGTWETEAALSREIAEHLPGLITRPGPKAWNEGHLGPLVIDAAATDLGYRPRVSLRDGLRELVEFYRARIRTSAAC